MPCLVIFKIRIKTNYLVFNKRYLENTEWSIQRIWQNSVHKTKFKKKQNKTKRYVLDTTMLKQTQINKNKSSALLETNRCTDEHRFHA